MMTVSDAATTSTVATGSGAMACRACLPGLFLPVRGCVPGCPGSGHGRPFPGRPCASCLPFIGSFEENSLLIHIDGGATDSASSAWIWESGKPTMIRASWDDLKDVVNNYNVNPLAQSILGLTMEDHLSMPGKLMEHLRYTVIF